MRNLLTLCIVVPVLGCVNSPAPVEFHYRTGTVKVYNAKISPTVVKIDGHKRVITPSAPGIKFAWHH